MSLLTVHFAGESVGKQMQMNVILPDGRGPFPVLYLLHGLSDDYTAWQRWTSIERYVEGKDLIVVMPDGGRSFYCNDPRPAGIGAYEDHIARDVVGFVDRTFRTIPRPGARAVAGLSMGGYGALMLAMRHPELFSVACSHSGAMGFGHFPTGRREIDEMLANYPMGHDLFALAKRCKRARRRLAIRLDCGTEDFLLDHNRQFHRHLEKLGLAHEYHKFPGNHEWDYWDLHIRETIDFVAKRL